MTSQQQQAVQQPADLIRFISNLPLLNDGTIQVNSLNGSTSFTSNVWTPVYSVSILAVETVPSINDTTIVYPVNDSLDPNTIVYQALNCDLATAMPNVYLLLRAVILEAFSLLYSMDYAPQNIKFISDKDFSNIKTNIKYIADYFSSDSRYYSLIKPMRDLQIAFGYMENQTKVIMMDLGVS